jgi:hypothetical protein
MVEVVGIECKQFDTRCQCISDLEPHIRPEVAAVDCGAGVADAAGIGLGLAVAAAVVGAAAARV